MPEFLPFVGTRYNKSTIDLAQVVAPPYDVISNEYRDALYERDEHNVIRLELNRDKEPYQSAARFLETWKKNDALVVESKPSFYVYSQIFRTPTGETVTREGVIGRLKLMPYSAKEVLPHERTLSAPKRDRLALMEATKANLSPIFGLISDPTFVFDQTLDLAMVHAPLTDIEEQLQNGESVRHILWRLDDPIGTERIEKIVNKDKVIIADGHHRYETAMLYEEAHPESVGAGYIMIFLTNLQSKGAVILPTHRLLHDAPNFDQYKFLDDLRKSFELVTFTLREEGMAALERDTQSFTLLEFDEDPKWVLVRDQGMATNSPTLSTLPAMRIQEEIFKPILGISQEAIDDKRNLLYPHTTKELDEMKESQATNVAFLLRPVAPQELAAIVEQGSFMPQKSTFFYPKLLTGLVFHEFALQQA